MMVIHVSILVILVSIVIWHGKTKDHFHAERVSLEVRAVVLWLRLVRLMVSRGVVLGVEAKDILQGAAMNGHGIPDGLLVRRFHVHHVDRMVHFIHRPVEPVVAVAVAEVQRGRLLRSVVGVVMLVCLVVHGGVVAVPRRAVRDVRVRRVDLHVVAVVTRVVRRRMRMVGIRMVRRSVVRLGVVRQVLRLVVGVGQVVVRVRVVDQRGVGVHEVRHSVEHVPVQRPRPPRPRVQVVQQVPLAPPAQRRPVRRRRRLLPALAWGGSRQENRQEGDARGVGSAHGVVVVGGALAYHRSKSSPSPSLERVSHPLTAFGVALNTSW